MSIDWIRLALFDSTREVLKDLNFVDQISSNELVDIPWTFSWILRKDLFAKAFGMQFGEDCSLVKVRPIRFNLKKDTHFF